MRHSRTVTLLAAGALAGCGGQARGPEGQPMEEPSATARLVDSSGARAGVATFSDSGGSAWLAVSVTGLTPGRHGMHIHESGSCTPPDFESAGGHFNPGSRQHGLKNPQGAHAGDLPNLVVEEDGSADTSLAVPAGLLTPEGATSMLGSGGRSFVIHADTDDEKTDPSGNSGGRVICGVIERG